MAYDSKLADRAFAIVEEADCPGVESCKMFGGIGYLVYGNMAFGILGERLIIRVGPDDYAEALNRAHTAPFDLTGRAMKGWVYILPEGLQRKESMRHWIRRGLQFATSLPPKPGRG